MYCFLVAQTSIPTMDKIQQIKTVGFSSLRNDRILLYNYRSSIVPTDILKVVMVVCIFQALKDERSDRA